MAAHPMRRVNKHFTNRITRRFARGSRGHFAILYHVGRRSGKPYETTIMVEQHGAHFVMALTYGSDVDWYRNVLATGQATLLWYGHRYTLDHAEPLAVQAALPLFPPFQRLVLRLRHTQHFVRFGYQEEQSTTQTTPGGSPSRS